MKLIGVSENQRDVRREIERHLDVAGANGVAGDVERRRYDVVHRDRSAFRLLLTRHREERAYDSRAPLGCGANLERGALRGCVALCLEQYRARHDDGKRVIEFMRDAREQRTQCRELLALVQRVVLALQFGRVALFLRDVAGDRQNVRLSLILHRYSMELELERGSILASLGHLEMKRFARRRQAQKRGVVGGTGAPNRAQSSAFLVAVAV